MTTRKPKLLECEKNHIENALRLKLSTVTELANAYGVHPKTINNVMKERGLLSTSANRPITEAERLKKLLKDSQISTDQLAQLVIVLLATGLTDPDQLKASLTTPQNVQFYLNQCSKEQLAVHFYTSGLIKLAEISRHVQQKQQAALFQPPAPQQQPEAALV